MDKNRQSQNNNPENLSEHQIIGLEKTIARELLKENRLKRKWGIFFKILVFVYATIAFFVFFPESSQLNLSNFDKATGLVRLEGVISNSAGSVVDDVITELQQAFGDERIVAVILAINSPGGSPVQSSYINTEIGRLRTKFPKKPLYVVIEDICASGGYFVASAATQIFANESSLIGSIGVRLDAFGFVETLEKLGIERRLLTAGKHKGIFDPFLPTKSGDEIHIQGLLEEIHQHFISVVKSGRDTKLKNPDEVFSGLIWTGKKSLELGLIDGLGSIDYVAREVVKVEKIINFTREKFPWENALKNAVMSLTRNWSKFSIW